MIDTSAQPAAGNSTTKAVVEAFFRHRNAFLTTAALVMLGTILATLLTPREFQSEMTILVRNARPDYLISPQANNGQIQAQDVTEERINSEIEVLRSKDVADAVVDPSWSAKLAASRPEAENKAHEKAVLHFLQHLDVALMRKSHVIHVSYLADSPSAASDTVQRLLSAFLAKQREIEQSTGASSFFAAEASRYKRDLDGAREQLAAYQQTNQIVSLPGKETTLESQTADLDGAIRATQVELNEAENRLASDRRELSMLPSRQPTQQRSIPNTQAVEALVADLNNYQNKRTALLTRYQPTDRLVTEVDQQIATTSAALAQARAINGEESTTDVNPIYQQVRAAITSGTTEVAALRARSGSQMAQRERIRRQLTGVESSTVDFNTLQSRVNELESNYQLYSQKRNEAEIADSMNQHQLVNVAVVENPTFSAKAYRPQVLVNLSLGLFTALFLGACVVFFAELGRDTIAAPYELEAISGAAVLATVPFVASEAPAVRTPARIVRAAAASWPVVESFPQVTNAAVPGFAMAESLAVAENATAPTEERQISDQANDLAAGAARPSPEFVEQAVATRVEPDAQAEIHPLSWESAPAAVGSLPLAEPGLFGEAATSHAGEASGFPPSSATLPLEQPGSFDEVAGDGSWDNPHRAASAPSPDVVTVAGSGVDAVEPPSPTKIRSSLAGEARSYVRNTLSGMAYRLRVQPRGRLLFEVKGDAPQQNSMNGVEPPTEQETQPLAAINEEALSSLSRPADAESTVPHSGGTASDGYSSHQAHSAGGRPSLVPALEDASLAERRQGPNPQLNVQDERESFAAASTRQGFARAEASQRPEADGPSSLRVALNHTAEIAALSNYTQATVDHDSAEESFRPADEIDEQGEQSLLHAEMEPLEPIAKQKLPLRSASLVADGPSRLTPSQRAQLSRPSMARDRNGRLSPVTYTLVPRRDRSA